MPKKAAKKSVKKAAKKAAKKGAAHSGDQDLRKAYEHLQRLRILHAGLKRDAAADVEALVDLAQRYLRAEDSKSAAALLRGAEHVAFGSLASREPETAARQELNGAAAAEFNALMKRATDRSHDGRVLPNEVWPILERMMEDAEISFRAGRLHRALELARGAEALTHAEALPARALKAPASAHVLRLH